MKYLNFMKYPFHGGEDEGRRRMKTSELLRKFCLDELSKKRDNEVYNGENIIDKYEEAEKNNQLNSNIPYWKLSNEDELDELLKLRQEINMIADGTVRYMR
jgi:hypothetical protein